MDEVIPSHSMLTHDAQRHDILILGGGPAGLSTALHLAQLAPELTSRILIIEKAHYPRQKLCAGGLLDDAEVILERLGLDVREVPHADAAAAHMDFAGRGAKIQNRNRERRKQTHIIRVIRRDEFDAWLAGKAGERGIEIREGVTVKRVQAQADCVIVETDAGAFRAQVVVGADGSNGVTRRCVLPDAPVHTARLLEVLTPAIAGNDGHQATVAYFDFFCVPDGIAGYTWDFPTQINGLPMRCWGIYDTNLLADGARPALKEPLAAEMGRHGFDLQDAEIKGFPIRWFSPFSPLSAPRVLLAGDAAGVDPIFGEGISIALGYGLIAAHAIVEAFEKRDFSMRSYKRRLLRSALGRALVLRWTITQIFYRLRWPWFQRGFWRRMGWMIRPGSARVVINWAQRMR
ncbi:MAG TPA: NAD(P)/FAD-dependent oxidoreductase [Anaerolineales bacterium]|jgi:flavin-dependent dehydrogenase